MPSIGLSLAKGKQVYDAEQQRRAEMETYKQNEVLRQARRDLMRTAADRSKAQLQTYRADEELRKEQRGLGIATAKLQRTLAEEEMTDQAKLQRQVQREIDLNKLAIAKIAAELGKDEAEAVKAVIQSLRKYQPHILAGDPKALTDAMAEAGFEGYTAEMDPDGWAGGLTVVGPQGAKITFKRPADALSDLSFLPLQASITKILQDRSLDAATKTKAAELLNDLHVQALKNRGLLDVANAKNMDDQLEALEKYAAISAGLTYDGIEKKWVQAETGETPTVEQLEKQNELMQEGAAKFFNTTNSNSMLLGAIQANMAARKAEIKQQASTKMIEEEQAKRNQMLGVEKPTFGSVVSDTVSKLPNLSPVGVTKRGVDYLMGLVPQGSSTPTATTPVPQQGPSIVAPPRGLPVMEQSTGQLRR